jgi:hypothetical protein
VVCGGAALVVAIGFGVAGAGEALTTATSPSSSVVPAPPSPEPITGGSGGGALPVQPAAGACIIGLNCGCIPHHTCPTPHPRPGNTGTNQHNPPAPQDP